MQNTLKILDLRFPISVLFPDTRVGAGMRASRNKKISRQGDLKGKYFL
jgi:hypothetical protein